MADLTTEIETNAQGPKQVTVDGIVMQEHSLPDQIEADRYLASKAASRAPRRGLVMTKMSPPGTA